MKLYSIVFSSLLLCSACTSTQKDAGAENINVRMLKSDVEGCQPLGEVVGNGGNWFHYWFTPNKELAQGAFNDLRNEAKSAGADTLLYIGQYDFTTSVTLIAEVYLCH